MKIKNKKASIFVYVLILINISLIIWYVVYNNTYILNNNIDIWRNSEEVFSVLSDKWNIAIDSVRQYNSNWGWFTDFISCPQNITMSWSTNRVEWLSSEMRYNFGTVYCYFEYNWDGVRLFFDPDTVEFQRAFYKWELRNIWNSSFLKWSELPLSISNSTTRRSSSYDSSNSLINNSSEYHSSRTSNAFIEYSINPATKIHSLELFKTTQWSTFWNQWSVSFLDSSRNVIFSTSLTWLNSKTYEEIILPYASYSNSNDIRFIRISSSWNNHHLNLRFVRVFWLNVISFDDFWIDSNFWDSDNTYLSFTWDWIWWWDNIDDNMNSDNYRSTSTWSISYPWDFLDDDIVPRLTFFWSVPPNSTEFYNIFWNNHITNTMVDWNFHNDDDPLITAKIWDVTRWFLFLDVFTFWWNLDYDIKIIQFDRDAYKDRFTLLPTAVYETSWVNQNYWYIQLNWNTMSLSPYKTWNEFEFNFSEHDYSIYLTNRIWENLAYKLSWEERPNVWTWPSSSWDLNEKWREIYINPIDDSKPWVIEVIANHIIAWWDKNYIWENFLMVWSK
jgi:hypothetical protein